MSSIGSGGQQSWHASLYEAATKGNEPRFRQLFEERSKFGDKHTEVLRIALQKVVGRGSESLTRFLLEEGAEVNTCAENDHPVIFRAAEAGRDKVLKILLEHNADIEARDKLRRTPIFSAAQRGHLNTVRLLIEAGANVNARDCNSHTVLLCLASEKSGGKQPRYSEQILRALLDTTLDLEVKCTESRTALLWAAALGKEPLARLLLAGRKIGNANIDAVNNRGKTALHLAAESGTERAALVEVLLDHGANPGAQADGGWTPLHNAADKGHTKIASMMLKRNANVNCTLANGMTPLHWAARGGHSEMVELLLKQPGCRRHCKDSADITPMLGAAENGHLHIVKMLSPSNDIELLSSNALGACKGFQATVVDFGMEHRPINNNKHSVFDVLYGWDEKNDKPAVTTLTRNVASKPTFRWIHLPTNNMSWVEALMNKYFVENSARDVDGFKLIEKSFNQAHRGPTVHSHFMRPSCQRMAPTGKEPPHLELEGSTVLATEQADSKGDQTVIAVTPLKDKSANEKKGGAKKADKPEKTAKGTPTSQGKKTKSNKPEATNGLTVKAPRRRDRHSNIVLFMPYLHYETHEKRTEMSNAIKHATTKAAEHDPRHSIYGSSDKMLIHGYLHSTYNLQVRRTLDQFYYHAISTEDRDVDQVVWRYTERDENKETKLFMVDQLWLWTLGDDLIITSFPQRWEQPKNDPLSVLDGVIQDMSSKTRPPVRSVYDLALLITGRCVGVFDRHSIHDSDFQFLDMFESSIGRVTNQETQLFKRFNEASVDAARFLRSSDERRKLQRRSGDDDNNGFVDSLLDIGEETALLAETKDIRDELNMISMVLKHQFATLEDLANALFQELKGNHNQEKQAEVRRRFKEQHKIIDMHLKDLERMDKQAEGIYTSLTHLLDLKQKHANAIEARFARDQAAFTGRQGQTIMVFTIVTVIFLPMSFIAAVFAIPISSFQREDGQLSLEISYVSKFMFGVGLAISIPLIAVAFAVDNIGSAIKSSIQRLNPKKWKSKEDASRDLDLREGGDDGKNLLPRISHEKRAGDMSLSSNDKSHLSPLPDSNIRHRTERPWRKERQWDDKPKHRRDLERGQM